MQQRPLLTAALPVPPGPVLALRDYQEAAIAVVLTEAAQGVRRPLVVLPTGTGKTVVFCHLARRMGCRTLILAHRDELIQQAAAKFRQVDPGVDLGIVKAEVDQHARRVVVASVQTLAQPHRLARLTRDFGLIVIDEAHHAAAKTYKTILRHFGSFNADGSGPLTVGVTATPDRGDGVGLKSVFQKIVFTRDLLSMIRQGYLCPLRGVEVKVDADLAGLPARRGDIAAAPAGAALLEAHAPEAIAAAYLHHANGLRAVVFTPTVAVAEATAAAFRAVGVAAKSLDGMTPIEERRRILAGLADGTTPVVCNCGVLTEGFDEPQIRCVIIARPTKSRALYTQMVGRGTRLAEGKRECLVLDVVGATRQHQLVTVATLVGRAAREAKKAAKSATGSTKGSAPPIGLPVDPERLRSAAVDLFAGSGLRWLQAGRSTFILALREGWLLVEPERAATDLWRVVQREGRYTTPEVLVGELDLVTAQALADDVARGLGPEPRDQRWRERPASPGQRDALKRWRVTPADDLTSGEASDQLTAIAAIATWRKAQKVGR